LSKYVSNKKLLSLFELFFIIHAGKQTLSVETTGDVLLRSALFSAAETGHLTPTHFKLI